ncbi:MAG: ArnT family glycosyltransferase [Spirochaetaceae bacterium]
MPTGRNEDRTILMILVIFVLAFRLFTLQMINEGPDEIDYWFSAVRLADSLPYPELTHRTVRWPIIVPTMLFAIPVGFHPIGYYIGPILLSLLQTVVLFNWLRGERASTGAAVIAVFLLTAFPYMMREGSQVRPEIYSPTYMLLAWAALWRWFREQERSAFLYLSALALFVAYLTKVTNLYFLPAMAWLIWQRGRSIKPLLEFGAFLLLLYLVEHAAYWLLAGESLGRLGIIASNHLTSDYMSEEPGGFFSLFVRYRFDRFQPVYWVFYLGAFAAWFVDRRNERNGLVHGMGVLLITFMICITFAVKSIDPIVPVEDYINRYFSATLPLVFGMIALVAWPRLQRIGLLDRLLEEPRPLAALVSAGMIALVAISVIPLGPVRHYLTPINRLSTHPMARFVSYVGLVEEGIEEERLFVSVDEPDGWNSKGLDTVNRVFLDYVNGSKPERERRAVITEAYRIDYLLPPTGDIRLTAGTEVLYVRREPLRLSRTTLGEVEMLEGITWD